MHKKDQNVKLPKVAILLAAYNGTCWIHQQMESILSQKYVDLRVFVSVDRSTDDTELYIKRYAKRDARIVLLSYGERYGSAASNFFRLILESPWDNFDYVALADQDDIWMDMKLHRAFQEMNVAKADGYSGNVLAFWPGKQEKIIKKAMHQRKWDYLFEGPGPGCTFVLTSSLAAALRSHIQANREQIRCLDWHDWFIYAFARSRGYRWFIDREPMMRYRQHERNQLGANAGLSAFIYRSQKIINGYAINQAANTARAVGIEHASFVRKWVSGSRTGFLWLAFHSFQCRRRVIDCIYFIVSCIFFYIKPPNMECSNHD